MIFFFLISDPLACCRKKNTLSEEFCSHEEQWRSEFATIMLRAIQEKSVYAKFKGKKIKIGHRSQGLYLGICRLWKLFFHHDGYDIEEKEDTVEVSVFLPHIDQERFEVLVKKSFFW